MRRKMSRERISSDWSTGDCDAGSTALVIRAKNLLLKYRLRPCPRNPVHFPLRHAPHASTSRRRILENQKKEERGLDAPLQTPSRRNARHLLRARRLQARRRLVPGE